MIFEVDRGRSIDYHPKIIYYAMDHGGMNSFFFLQVRIRTLPDKVTIRELHKQNHKKQKLLKLKKKKKYIYATKFRKSKAALGGAGGSFGLKLPKFMNKHIWRAQHRQHQKPILSNEVIGKEIYQFSFGLFYF